MQVIQMEAEEVMPTRQSLLPTPPGWGNKQDWREFFDTYGELSNGVAFEENLADDEQATIVSAARKIPGVVYDPVEGLFKS